jgi:hypothetical protein
MRVQHYSCMTKAFGRKTLAEKRDFRPQLHSLLRSWNSRENDAGIGGFERFQRGPDALARRICAGYVVAFLSRRWLHRAMPTFWVMPVRHARLRSSRLSARRIGFDLAAPEDPRKSFACGAFARFPFLLPIYTVWGYLSLIQRGYFSRFSKRISNEKHWREDAVAGTRSR